MQQLVRRVMSLFEDPVASWAPTANAVIKNKTKQNHPTDQMPLSREKAVLCENNAAMPCCGGDPGFRGQTFFPVMFVGHRNGYFLGLSSDSTLQS